MPLSDFFASRLSRPAARVLDAPIRDIVQEVLRDSGYASPAEVQALRDSARDLKARLDGIDRRAGELARLLEEARAESGVARADAQAARSEAQAARSEAQEATARANDARADAHAARGEAGAARGEAGAARGEAEAAAAVAAEASLEAAPDPRIAALEEQVRRLLEARPAPAVNPPRHAEKAILAAEERSDCKVPGCDEDVRSRGFCSAHYQQWRRGTLRGFVGIDGTVVWDGRPLTLSPALAGGLVTEHDGAIHVDGKRADAPAAT